MAHSLTADVTESIDVVTHSLFVAEVVACEILDADKQPITYAYYRDVKKGKTPKSTATYVKVETKA